MSVRLLTGDCRELMATLDTDSIDAVVCDPPYELNFMGRSWDRAGVAFDPDTWRAVLRVMKPGAHLAAFGSTRTYHRMVVAIEDAGFNIRDTCAWITGQGFPKSVNISKAIDKAAGAEREIVGLNPNHRPVSGVNYEGIYAGGNTGSKTLTAPATDAARQWDGWGSALKPSMELIVLARKPLSEQTIAANVLKHSTGGLNIDACRIGTDEHLGRPQVDQHFPVGLKNNGYNDNSTGKGRWPANVLLDEESAAALDQMSAPSQSRIGVPRSSVSSGEGWGMTKTGAEYDDQGGPSRFFFTAKSSRAERNKGLEGLEEKPLKIRDDLTPEQREWVLSELAAAGVAL